MPSLKVMDKEVDDIIQDCIRPNFVEMPEVIDQLPTPEMRGLCHPPDTDLEYESLGDDEDDLHKANQGTVR